MDYKREQLLHSLVSFPTSSSSSSPSSTTEPTMDSKSEAEYLLTIKAVRERCNGIVPRLESDGLTNFDVDLTKLVDVADFVQKLIQRDYGTNYDSIPPHGRWQHFEVGGRKRVDNLINEWDGVSKEEQTKRLLDLFTVSVLLDAGAGSKWKYTEQDGTVSNRSEGLAVASLDMFKSGIFSTAEGANHQVDSQGLKNLTTDKLTRGMQVNAANPMEGLDGRANLLVKLGHALDNKKFFANGRPGDLLDYLLAHPAGNGKIDVLVLWDVLMEGFGPIWPEGRTKLGGVALGDAWYCETTDNIVPFHKLTQWLCYSLVVPLKRTMGLQFENEHLLTGLPEYRNGGLFVDFGVLKLKPQHDDGRQFEGSSSTIVEWRAATVVLLDKLLTVVNHKLNANLVLPQLLEAGTWKAGREIAREKRPETNNPPISIISDGTLF